MVEQNKDVSYADLKSRISQGWGWEDFEVKYGLSKTRLKRHIRQNLCKSENYAGRLIKTIESNTKRKRKQERQLCADDIIDVEPLEAESERESPEITKSVELERIEDFEDAAIVSLPIETNADKLAGLKWEEAHKCKLLDSLVGKRNKLIDQRDSNIAGLHKLEVEHGKLIKALRAKTDECVELRSLTEQQRLSIEELEREMQEAELSLVDIRQQIANLDTIKLFAYCDGTIESIDGEIAMDDSGYKEYRHELYDVPECQGIMTQDVNLLARLHCIVDHADKRVEVTFENEGLEQIFTKLHSEHSAA